MLKRDVFSQAMKSRLYEKLAWLIGAFSIVSDDADKWESEKYSWRIVQLPSGNYVVHPNDGLVLIEDAPVGQPPFDFNDEVAITPEDIPTCAQALTTTYGNWFVNWLLLYMPFGNKIAYMEGDITPGRIESILLKKFRSNAAAGEKELADAFYVHEYLTYVDALYFLTGLTQLCVWAATRKTLLPAPGIQEYKEKLLEENKDTLNELATIAKIDKALTEYDTAYLQGDPGKVFLDGDKKAIPIVRKKLYGMAGAETGLSESSVYGVLIKKALSEGWEIDKFPIMNDTLRGGSFNRGAQTQLGGVSVKWLYRASANMNITVDDCGSKMGIRFDVTEANKSKLVGFTLTDGKKNTVVADEAMAGSYLGQRVRVRSPMYCQLPLTDYCKTCVGPRLAVNPDGLSVTVADYGSALLNIFLKLMHGKKLATARMDYKTAIT